MPKRLLDTAMDAISRALEADCCWVQLIGPSDGVLSLCASCGLTPRVQRRISAMDLHHPLGRLVVGSGNALVVPDLSRDGDFGLSVLQEEGFRSLIAVPILTYRGQGIMGVAYRAKKRFSREETGLLTTTAGVIGMAFNKCLLFEQDQGPAEAHKHADSLSPRKSPLSKRDLPNLEQVASEAAPPSQNQLARIVRNTSETRDKHLQRIKDFVRNHKAGYGRQ